MEKISAHISYNEATRSATAIREGIVNIPNEDQLRAMRKVGNLCFEPVRIWYGRPIYTPSFFRCPTLNVVLGGSETSQHPKGEAIDMDTYNDEENLKIFLWCLNHLEYDQLILEYGGKWVHISYCLNPNDNRNEVLEAYKNSKGETKYKRYPH